MKPYLYVWRYQTPTDVAQRQPAQLEREAIWSAVRDCRKDGWHPVSPPVYDSYRALDLDNVTNLVVTFTATRTPQEVHSLPEVEETLPAQPLVDVINGRNLSEVFTDNQKRAFYHGRKKGEFTLRMADELSLAVGRSIESVWPSDVASHASPMMDAATEGAA